MGLNFSILESALQNWRVAINNGRVYLGFFHVCVFVYNFEFCDNQKYQSFIFIFIESWAKNNIKKINYI